MKPTNLLLACRLAAIPSLFCLSGIAPAAPLYWDSNGLTAGSSSTTSAGGNNTWGRNNVWSTSPDGDVETIGYIQDSDVFLAAGNAAAGTGATGAYIIRINGAQRANSITFEEGTVTLSSGNTNGDYLANGGSLSLGAGGITLAAGLEGNAAIAAGLGTLTLTANQSWTNNSSRTLTVDPAVAGTATAGNTQTLTVGSPGSGSNGGITISGAISDGSGGGTLALTKAGNNNLALSGNNTYTGLTTVAAGGILTVRHNNALGSTAAGTEIAANAALRLENNVTVTGETLKISGTPLTGNSAALVNQSGDNVWTGNVTLDNSSGNNSRFSSNSGTLDLRGNVFIDSSAASGGAGTGLVLTGNGGVSTISGNISGAGSNQHLIKNGSSTWVLSGNNTYGGVTRVDDGVLSISSFANNLGTPTTSPNNTIINLGEANATGTLRYTGTGETVTRTFILRPGGTNTGGGVIEQSGASGTLILSGNITSTSGTVGKNLTLQGSTIATGEVTGNIANSGGTDISVTSLTKAGTGSWTLSGTNKSYTGTTTVTGGTLNVTTRLTGTAALDIANGTLALGAADRLQNAAAVTLRGGGILQTAGSETFATLAVRGASTLDLSVGSSLVNFANSSGVDWTGGLLTILGWNGTADTGGGAEQVVFADGTAGLTTGQVSQIQFSLVGGIYSAKMLASGEIVPDALIPEASTAVLAILGGMGVVARRRRK